MNKNKAKELSDILLAHSEGKTVQIKMGKDWITLTDPNFNNLDQPYRIKPEPKLVPFTTNDIDLFMNKWICDKLDTNLIYNVIGIDKKNNEIRIGDDWVSFEDLLSEYQFEDGSPCGKYIEE